jgi:hypothetical protein
LCVTITGTHPSEIRARARRSSSADTGRRLPGRLTVDLDRPAQPCQCLLQYAKEDRSMLECNSTSCIAFPPLPYHHLSRMPTLNLCHDTTCKLPSTLPNTPQQPPSPPIHPPNPAVIQTRSMTRAYGRSISRTLPMPELRDVRAPSVLDPAALRSTPSSTGTEAE